MLASGSGSPGGGGGGGGDGDVPGLSGGGAGGAPTEGHGKEGLGNNPDGDDADGPGKGRRQPLGPGDSSSGQAASAGPQLEGDLLRMTEGKPLALGDADDPTGTPAPQGKSYAAHDFTYDKTQLPRYPDAVTAVVSSISYGPDGRTDRYSTGAGILTTSSFDTVVAWYKKNLPPGWHDLTIGDLGQLSRQLSAQNIGKLLGQATQDANSPAGTAAATTASAAADQLRISLFQPPPGSPIKTGVMIVQHGDTPVEALLQAKIGSP
jgi:hypothetical protein